jgi:hypothetical protein
MFDITDFFTSARAADVERLVRWEGSRRGISAPIRVPHEHSDRFRERAACFIFSLSRSEMRF